MYKDLSEQEKEYYLKLAKELLRGTYTECNDCSIHSGSGLFVSSYKDTDKLNEVAEKLYKLLKK